MTAMREPAGNFRKHVQLPRKIAEQPANLIEQVLSRTASAPDLTDSIMSRLGYARVSKRHARQLAIARVLRRGCAVAVGAIVLAMGFYLHSQSDLVRRPSGPTVPSAIRQDFHHHGNAVQGFLQSIQKFTPQLHAPQPTDLPETSEDSAAPPGNVDPAATAPFQWV